MTPSQLVRAVAAATGESRRTIDRLGFRLLDEPSGQGEPDDLVLALDCPFCGHPIVLTTGPGDTPGLTSCDPCDVEFDFGPDEIYATDSRDLEPVTHAA
jgi:hypothetical protein